MSQLSDFIVIKSLQVGDLKIEPSRVSATYKVIHFDGRSEQTELIYSYPTKLFDKDYISDVNIASMILAQVALNYGIFCEELVFDGLFDKIDRDFLIHMTENTSREILTNKLLIHNEFLVKPYDTLDIPAREKFTQAKIVFSNLNNPSGRIETPNNLPRYDKYAILSSGGKDSLLSYGLISEFGEPHPIFVNESGRHWFTAVNAFRYFETADENTMRIWTNCDRVFNWMLRQMKFIRRDYSTIRADIYPVRLWTVAVFLFGVLPVALKRGLGNIIIGDEYDTTVRGSTGGISHYSGLYDQSKYFDNALTRYYLKKGWQIYQYSLLRSMSELLIMKVLLKRYPILQRHQMSCHAAHEHDKRMYPCGKCEKCRRIIGMVSALDENPNHCGYNNEQIKNALNSFAQKKVKQIGSDASQLFHMLLSKGLIPTTETTIKLAKEHKQVMKLRFDREKSNLEDMPNHVRKPLFSILKQYANGAAVKKENKWIDINLSEKTIDQINYKYNASKK